jgi:hypothetical protein
MIKRLSSHALIFPNKISILGDLIRNKFPHWSFSKFELGFELKIGEPI